MAMQTYLPRLLVFLLAIVTGAAGAQPQTVSPGATASGKVGAIGERCPTFSWSAERRSTELEILVFRETADASEPEIVMRKQVPGMAQSWTPDLSQCLEWDGSYGWSVRRLSDPPSPWSMTRHFDTPPDPAARALSRAMDIMREQSATAAAGPHASDTNAGTESEERTAAPSAVTRRAMALRAGRDAPGPSDQTPEPGQAGDRKDASKADQVSAKTIGSPTIIRGANQATSGVNYGLAGEAASPDGAAVAASNLGGGADVMLLDSTNPPASLSESGMLFESPDDILFDIENIGAGNVRLRQGGDNLVTTATDEDTLTDLVCTAGQVAKFSGSAWLCGEDLGSNSGDITAVNAGTGLSGGGTSGDVSISVNPDMVQTRVSGTCPTGEWFIAVNSDGSVICEAETGDISGITAGTGLTGDTASGEATLDVDFSTVQARLGSNCPTGKLLSGISSDGSPVCSTPDPYGGAVNIPVAAFEETDGDDGTNAVDWTILNEYLILDDRAGLTPPILGQFVAPVFLPDGASITRVVIYAYDNDASLDLILKASLRRHDLSMTGSNQIASVSQIETSGASTSIQTLDETNTFNQIVDNSSYNYFINATFTADDESLDLRFYGVRIEYSML